MDNHRLIQEFRARINHSLFFVVLCFQRTYVYLEWVTISTELDYCYSEVFEQK